MRHSIHLFLATAAAYQLPVRPAAQSITPRAPRIIADASLLADGDAMEAGWDKLRGRPLRRSLALWRFFSVAAFKCVRANRTDDDVLTNATAAWVQSGLLRLGPTMIKLGQVFSSRTDLLHPAYCEALVQLQTAVPSVSGPRVRTLLEEELGSPLPFDSFDETPIAGASLGQVHRAVYNGKQVAVKIQRAQLQQLFDTDFRNIRMGCRMMNGMERVRERVRRWRGKGKSAADRDWMQYAADAARLLYMEIDYLNEGKNAEAFAKSLKEVGSSAIVPGVVWEATTPRVLTMDYIESVKLTDSAAMDSLKLNRKALAQKVVDTFLVQLLQTGVLHCDPHPGNLCVSPKGRLVLYDFGMMDTLPDGTVQGLRRLAFALFGGSSNPSDRELEEAGAELMKGLEEAQFLVEGADEEKVRKVGIFLVRFFRDQAAGRDTQDVTEQVGAELQSLLDSGYICFPSAFTFVGRAFTSVDGIAKALQPDYEFRDACEPFVGRLISDEYGRKAEEQRDELFKKLGSWLNLK